MDGSTGERLVVGPGEALRTFYQNNAGTLHTGQGLSGAAYEPFRSTAQSRSALESAALVSRALLSWYLFSHSTDMPPCNSQRQQQIISNQLQRSQRQTLAGPMLGSGLSNASPAMVRGSSRAPDSEAGVTSSLGALRSAQQPAHQDPSLDVYTEFFGTLANDSAAGQGQDRLMGLGPDVGHMDVGVELSGGGRLGYEGSIWTKGDNVGQSAYMPMTSVGLDHASGEDTSFLVTNEGGSSAGGQLGRPIAQQNVRQTARTTTHAQGDSIGDPLRNSVGGSSSSNPRGASSSDPRSFVINTDMHNESDALQILAMAASTSKKKQDRSGKRSRSPSEASASMSSASRKRRASVSGRDSVGDKGGVRSMGAVSVHSEDQRGGMESIACHAGQDDEPMSFGAGPDATGSPTPNNRWLPGAGNPGGSSSWNTNRQGKGRVAFRNDVDPASRASQGQNTPAKVPSLMTFPLVAKGIMDPEQVCQFGKKFFSDHHYVFVSVEYGRNTVTAAHSPHA